MRWSVATAIVLSVSFLAGCEVLGGFEELTGRTGAAGTAGAAGESAAGAAGAASCEGQVLAGLKGAPPRGHLQRDGTCVYVDEREATEAEYAQFAAEESVENQTLVCPSSVNPSFAPAASCRVDPNPKADLPIVCVDQCDALAFCAWAGKSLCRGGTTPGQGDTSAWFEACSGNDTQDYPYAGPHQPGFCNDSTNAPAGGSGQLVPAGSQSKCVTADGVKDLSGNVAEWTDDCTSNAPGEGNCVVRGGAATDGPSATKCSSTIPRGRLTVDPRVGLRCCVYPP